MNATNQDIDTEMNKLVQEAADALSTIRSSASEAGAQVRPPPPTDIPPGKKAEWVKERKMPNGHVMPAGYRLVNIDRKQHKPYREARTGQHNEADKTMVRAYARRNRDGSVTMIDPYPKTREYKRSLRKPARKPDTRHHVDPKYAMQLVHSLDVPVALLTGMRMTWSNAETHDMLTHAISALTEARAFIRHFTTHPNVE